MNFDTTKLDSLSKLNAGVDFSPKGSIDLPTLELVNFLNSLPNYVTTSSCSGRISVYLNEHNTKGIRWIHVKHRTVNVDEVKASIGSIDSGNTNLVMLKCEPCILHVSCRDIESGKQLHQIAMGCGFRESGVSIGQKGKVLVAIRTTAFNLELPLARGSNFLVDNAYMDLIIAEANTKLQANFARSDRLLMELKRVFQFPTLTVTDIVNNAESDVRRWGHTSVTTDKLNLKLKNGTGKVSHMIIGGNGVDSGVDENKCKRGLATVLHSDNKKFTTTLTVTKEQTNDSMHAVGVELSVSHKDTKYSMVIMSGGRTSPNNALPCIASIMFDSTTNIVSNPVVAVQSAVEAKPKGSKGSKDKKSKSGEGKNENTPLEPQYTIKHTESGDIPRPRWGHSLTQINYNSYLLYGGRNATGILCEAESAFVLTCVVDSVTLVADEVTPIAAVADDAVNQSTVEVNISQQQLKSSQHEINLIFTWTKLVLPSPLPPARFFHAAVSIEDVYVEGEDDTCGRNYVLVHGGLVPSRDKNGLDEVAVSATASEHSLEDLVTSCDAFIINPWDGGSVQYITSDVCTTGGTICTATATAAVAAAGTSATASSAADVIYASGTGATNALDGTVMKAKKDSKSTTDATSISRFGHTLTKIGAKSLLLIGGASTALDSIPVNRTENATFIIDISMTVTGGYALGYRPSDIINSQLYDLLHPVEATSTSTSTSSGSSVAPNTLPCQECRAHHTVHYDLRQCGTNSNRLKIQGGGLMSLAFGPHLCCSVDLHVGTGGSAKADTVNGDAATTEKRGMTITQRRQLQQQSGGNKQSKIKGGGLIMLSTNNSHKQSLDYKGDKSNTATATAVLEAYTNKGKKDKQQQSQKGLGALVTEEIKSTAVKNPGDGNMAANTALLKDREPTRTNINTQRPSIAHHVQNPQEYSKESVVTPVILVPPKYVKRVKTVLETQGMLNKSVSICKVVINGGDISNDSSNGDGDGDLTNIIYYDITEGKPVVELPVGTDIPVRDNNDFMAVPVLPEFIEQLTSTADDKSGVVNMIRDVSSAEEIVKKPNKAVSLASNLSSTEGLKTAAAAEAATTCGACLSATGTTTADDVSGDADVGTDSLEPDAIACPCCIAKRAKATAVTVMSNNNASANADKQTMPTITTNSKIILLTAVMSTNRVSKRVLANTFQTANDYLIEYMCKMSIHSGDKKAQKAQLPAKYEICGDFLMIPSDALCSDEWTAFFNSCNTAQLTTFWSNLAAIFSLQKVARKSIIDSGILRESKVVILLPVQQNEAEADTANIGPGSVGWNTVHENKIAYSFNITKVMFCSGNITEKIRMAAVNANGQKIVDFYCGIGYYSVPLLVHAKAKHVIALEWNRNSVLALRENMRQNKVDPSRFTILQGDNRVTSVENNVVNVADRILLGLLPSSVPGWILAARALKDAGGVIHVHENVTDRLINTWVEDTIAEFTRLLSEAKNGREYTVTKLHLEKVKSYAPHVYHVVLDLHCVPAATV